jgi:PAS domain S-box-containing protein
MFDENAIFRSLVENSVDAIFRMTLTFEILYVSPAIRGQLGYEPEELLGRTIFDLIHEPDRPSARAKAGRSTEPGVDSTRGTERWTHKDGRLVWIDANGRMVRAKDGQPNEIIVVTRDVSAHKQAEQTLRESEERFRGVFEYAPFGIAITGLDGRFHRVNTALCSMLGYPEDQLQGVTFRDITFHEDVSPSQGMRERLLQDPTQIVELEKRYVHSNGSVVWAHLKISLVTDNGVPLHFVGHVEDITERRRAAEALRESEDRFRIMADGSRTMMWVTDATGGVEFINRVYTEFSGYSCEELQVRKWQSLIHPDDEARYAAAFTLALKEHTGFSQEGRFRRADGEWRILANHAEPRFSSSGEFQGYFGTSTDINEYRQAQEMRERLAAIVNFSDDAIIGKDLNGIITAWNRGAEKIFGYSAAEMIGRPMLRLFPPDRVTEEIDILQRIGRGETVDHFETIRVRKDGAQIHVSATISPIYGGDNLIIGASKVARDITQQKHAEQELRAQADLLDLSHDGIMLWDLQGRIRFWNRGAEEIYGFGREQAVGAIVHALLRTVFPQSLIEIQSELLRKGRWEGELTHTTKAGVRLVVDSRWVLQLDSHGDPLHVMEVNNDITVRKQAEEALRQAKREADKANSAKSEFLANMSHEIRTPLNGIIGMTDLALGTGLTAEQRDFLETTRFSADALLSVINDILDFSKIEAGKIQIEEVVFSLTDCVEGALKMMAQRASEKGLALLCKLAADVPQIVKGDPGRLRQVLLNLVGNALKFTAEGEVGVRVMVDAIEEKGSILHFIVFDSGVGIAPDKFEMIFDSFNQADASTTRQFGGTGLGLTISRRLVQLMGGGMWVESELGAGSRFHFTVRLVPEARSPVIPKDTLPEKGDVSRRLQILLAEDNRVNQKVATQLLKKRGHQVVHAGNGEEALGALAERSFDLVLMDVHMPGMDGIEATMAIREKEKSTGLHQPIIAMTALAMTGDRERCLAAGMDGYLSKPIDLRKLDELLTKFAGRRLV